MGCEPVKLKARHTSRSADQLTAGHIGFPLISLFLFISRLFSRQAESIIYICCFPTRQSETCIYSGEVVGTDVGGEPLPHMSRGEEQRIGNLFYLCFFFLVLG